MAEENVFRGVNRQIPTAQVNVGTVLYESLSKRDRYDIIFDDSETGEVLTIGELLDKSCQLAKKLIALIGKSEKVIAIASENNIQYFIVLLSALRSGVPIALLDPNYTVYELRSILSITKPDLVFCSMTQCPKYTKVLVTYRSIKQLVVIDTKDKGKQFDDLESFVSGYSSDESSFVIKDINVRNHTAFILFSSGTTGLPKGVMLSHFGVNATMATVNDPSIKSPIDGQTALAMLPYFHVFGLFILLLAIDNGKKIVVMKKFDPETYLRNIEKYKIARLSTVPPLIQFLLNSPMVDKYDLSSLQEIGCGAAMLPEKLGVAVTKKYNLKYLRIGYGLTESGLGVSAMPYVHQRPGSVGKLYPGFSAVIRDVKTGRNLTAYDQGEICVKSETIMKGYYGNPDATRGSFTKDGWLKTGDIGYFDFDGYLYIVDRLKEVIKYKGFQIPPAELEAILLTHPKIEDAGVIGRPDDDAGELATAFVVKKPNVKLTENEVKVYLAGFVKREKHLHGGVIFIDEIPKSPAGKIKRKDLKYFLDRTKAKL